MDDQRFLSEESLVVSWQIIRDATIHLMKIWHWILTCLLIVFPLFLFAMYGIYKLHQNKEQHEKIKVTLQFVIIYSKKVVVPFFVAFLVIYCTYTRFPHIPVCVPKFWILVIFVTITYHLHTKTVIYQPHTRISDIYLLSSVLFFAVVRHFFGDIGHVSWIPQKIFHQHGHSYWINVNRSTIQIVHVKSHGHQYTIHIKSIMLIIWYYIKLCVHCWYCWFHAHDGFLS